MEMTCCSSPLPPDDFQRFPSRTASEIITNSKCLHFIQTINWIQSKLQYSTRRFICLFIYLFVCLFVWCSSVYAAPKVAAQIQNVRWSNTYVLVAKNFFLSCILLCVCFWRTSSLLYLLQWNIPSQACLSLAYLGPSHVWPSKTPSNQLLKEPDKFPPHSSK